VVTGEATAISTMGAGKKAARTIAGYLREKWNQRDPVSFLIKKIIKSYFHILFE